MRIALGADHAGFALKDELEAYLAELGHETRDLGTDSPESVDYPDYAFAVARLVADGSADYGVLVCGTGLGMAIGANRVDGVRAVTCSNEFSARMARAHNDANVLTLGARVVGAGLAHDILLAFVRTEFEGGRHQRRLDKLASGST